MNPDNYTKEDLNANAEAARATWAAATADAADAAANNAAEYAAEYNAGAAKHWVNRYFDLTGENRQDYIDAINKAQKASKKKKGNPVEPNHYVDMKLSPLEYIMANEGDFTWCIANVIKYVSRYKRKNGVEDLRKAKWYLERQIQELEKQSNTVTNRG